MFAKAREEADPPLTRWKKSATDKGRALPKGRQDTETSASLRVATLIVEQSGYIDGQSREDATRSEVDGCIPGSCLGLILDSRQHQVANGTHSCKAGNEPASLTIPVRAPSSEHAAQEGEEVSGRCQNLGVHRAISHVADYRRQET